MSFNLATILTESAAAGPDRVLLDVLPEGPTAKILECELRT